ncbi:MAG: hypothetical protein ACK559_40185, partial [bacterium]
RWTGGAAPGSLVQSGARCQGPAVGLGSFDALVPSVPAVPTLGPRAYRRQHSVLVGSGSPFAGRWL